MCTSSVEKSFFSQSLLPLLPLLNYLPMALTYGVCALCAFILLKRNNPKPQKSPSPNKTTTFMAIRQVLKLRIRLVLKAAVWYLDSYFLGSYDA